MLRRTPQTWLAGMLVTDTMMNQQVRDQLLSLTSECYHTQTFRGLVLRTHPDADKAVNQVSLVACEQLLTDLGTRVSPRKNLSADITVGGAGGLDTGARTASKWYSVWYGFKGYNATAPDTPTAPASDCIFLHREKDYKIDQSNATVDTSERLRQGASDRVKLEQSVQVATLGPFVVAEARLNQVGAIPSGNVWFTLEADVAGAPSGIPLAKSDMRLASSINASTQWIRFIFRAPSTMTTGTTYHVVLQGDYPSSGTNYLRWEGNSTSAYANGSGQKFDGTSWAAASCADFAFRVYITESDAAPTLPTGYTEKCLLGYVYNSSGNALVPFWAVDRRVATLEQSLGAVSATIPTLIDLSAFVPPVPCRIVGWDLQNSGAGNYNVVSPDPTSAGSPFGIYWEEPVSARYMTTGFPVPVEYQALYFLVSAGTGLFYLKAWEW